MMGVASHVKEGLPWPRPTPDVSKQAVAGESGCGRRAGRGSESAERRQRTLGTSRDSGRNRVPRDEPPTWRHNSGISKGAVAGLPLRRPGSKPTRMTALVTAWTPFACFSRRGHMERHDA